MFFRYRKPKNTLPSMLLFFKKSISKLTFCPIEIDEVIYMIPEEVKYIENFKLNQNGKVDRKFYSKNINV